MDEFAEDEEMQEYDLFKEIQKLKQKKKADWILMSKKTIYLVNFTEETECWENILT